jgi:hypothetical protein
MQKIMQHIGYNSREKIWGRGRERERERERMKKYI